jgi:hypothetical protein
MVAKEQIDGAAELNSKIDCGTWLAGQANAIVCDYLLRRLSAPTFKDIFNKTVVADAIGGIREMPLNEALKLRALGTYLTTTTHETINDNDYNIEDDFVSSSQVRLSSNNPIWLSVWGILPEEPKSKIMDLLEKFAIASNESTAKKNAAWEIHRHKNWEDGSAEMAAWRQELIKNAWFAVGISWGDNYLVFASRENGVYGTIQIANQP